MSLGTEVGLGPGEIVLDRDPALRCPLCGEDPLFGGMNVSQQRFVRSPRIKIWHCDAY